MQNIACHSQRGCFDYWKFHEHNPMVDAQMSHDKVLTLFIMTLRDEDGK